MADSISHANRESRKEMSRGKKITLIVVAVLVVAALSAAGAVAIFGRNLASSFENNADKIEEAFPDESLRPPEKLTGSQTFLLLGSDTRGGIDPTKMDEEQDGRADSILVAHIPEKADKVYIISLMRDSWVDLEGFGEAKLNAALAYGGVPLAVQTVENLIGTRIDHIVTVDFEGFAGMTDALGGVTLNNPLEFSTNAGAREDGKSFDFAAGDITLDGEEALAFVRERYAFTDSDYQRVKNQQLYIKSMMRQLLTADTLLNPGKLQAVVESISPYIARDDKMDVGYLMGLIPKLRDVRADDIVFFTAPTLGTGTSDDGQSIVVLDETRMSQLKEAFINDTLDQYVATVDLNAS